MDLHSLLTKYINSSADEYFDVDRLVQFLQSNGVGASVTESIQEKQTKPQFANFKNIGKVRMLSNKVLDHNTVYCSSIKLIKESNKLKFKLNEIDYTISTFELSESGDPIIKLKYVTGEDCTVKLQVNPILGEGFTLLQEGASISQPTQSQQKKPTSMFDELGTAAEILEGVSGPSTRADLYSNSQPNRGIPTEVPNTVTSVEEIKSGDDLLMYAAAL